MEATAAVPNDEGREKRQRLGDLNGPWVAAHKLLTFLVPAITAIAIAVGGGALAIAFGHTERITALEGTKLSVSEGAALWREIASIRETLAHVPGDLMPGSKIENRLERLELGQESMVRTLIRMEERMKLGPSGVPGG